MEDKKLVIIGASAMAREAYVYARECGWHVKGFLDSRETILDGFSGYPPILSRPEDYALESNEVMICAVGDGLLRRRYVALFSTAEWATLIHPSAYCGSNVRVGQGSIVAPGVVLTTDIDVGCHTIINVGTTINHDCKIRDYVTISPGCRLAGRVEVGRGAFLGIGATLIPDVRLGNEVQVAAGAVVTRSLDVGRLMGLPARNKVDKRVGGKKLLVLAGTAVHVKVVNAAKRLGVHTIVVDNLPVEDSPAKQVADEHWEISLTDIDALIVRSRTEKIDGVIGYCNDLAQVPYCRIAESLGLPCYGSPEQFGIMTNKTRFKAFCRSHGVDVVPEYSIGELRAGAVRWPVLVKPTDSRGSRGQTICRSLADVDGALQRAVRESSDGQVIIERYMQGCQDMGIAYAVINGEPFLLKCGDRELGRAEDRLERQHISTVMPSRHIKEFLAGSHLSVCQMIRALGIRFGAVFLQGFWEGGRVYMYDPGLRLPGSDFDLALHFATGFDFATSSVLFALTGDATCSVGDPVKAYTFGGGACIILSIAVRPGRIVKYEGWDKIVSDPNVLSANMLQAPGSQIEATGDIRQRAAELIAYLALPRQVESFCRRVYETLKIVDESGENMIVSRKTFF